MAVTGNVLVLKSLIEKAVRENSQPDDKPSATKEGNLRQYFERDDTKDLVYDAVMARAETNSHNPIVLQHCIRLLKNVSVFVPGAETRRRIADFCTRVEKVSDANAVARQGLVSIRAIASRPANAGSGYLQAPAQNGTAHRRKRSSVDYSEAPRTHNVAWDDVAGDKSASTVVNFLNLRKPVEPVSNLNLLPTLYHCVHFGGQFRRNLTGPGSLPVGEDGVIVLTEVEANHQRIRDVGQSKRTQEVTEYKENGMLTVRRRHTGMPQYKFYTDQVPLDMRPELLEEALTAMVEKPVGARAIERRMVACKIVIKVFLDMYAAQDWEATDNILMLLLDMMARPNLDTRMMTFSLLFNLSIHSHILCDPSTDNGRARILQVEGDLYKKLCEVLLALYQSRSTDVKLWTHAFNLWLYFVTEDNPCHDVTLSKSRVLKLDPRIYVRFLEYLPQVAGDGVTRVCVRALVNSLYPVSQALDVKRLEHIGGIPTIIQLYTTVRSDEAIDNLFVVIFDNVVHLMGERKQLSPSTKQVQLAFELLKVYKAPRLLVEVFKYIPEKFVENFVRFAFFDQLKKTTGLTSLSDLLDKKLVVTLLYDIEKVAHRHFKLPQALQSAIQHLVTVGLGAHSEGMQHLATISTLVRSDRYIDRHQAEVCIHALLHAVQAGTAPKWLAEQVATLFDGLAVDANPLTRRSYLNLTERLVLMHKSKIVSYADEARLEVVLRTLNDKLIRLVQAKESNQGNLIKMVDIIMNLVSIRKDPDDPSQGMKEQAVDNVYNAFMNGHAILPMYLVRNVNTGVIRHVLMKLTSPRSADMRAVLVFILTEQCGQSKALLDSVGGMNFFRQLLKDRNPAVALLSSRFLLQQLWREKPDLYRAHLNSLIAKARELDDERLLDNPYLQITNLLS